MDNIDLKNRFVFQNLIFFNNFKIRFKNYSFVNNNHYYHYRHYYHYQNLALKKLTLTIPNLFCRSLQAIFPSYNKILKQLKCSFTVLTYHT